METKKQESLKRSSTSGTLPTGKFVPRGTSLHPDAVCRILDQSAKSGVAELTYCGLHVKFGRTAEQEEKIAPGTYLTGSQNPVTALTEEQHSSQNKRTLEQTEVELKEGEIERLLIEDPFKAEQLLRDGELDDGDGDTADDE